ncbi:hypothetical protein [Haloprofundus salinisoli]|uniref:hypothetical protein n=1 Tax=Haloprofundus salinisoli TaxID=2876193 RepID=UPI001CCB614E|nr:hypothetical protein [Haloprofundus salinisoli]
MDTEASLVAIRRWLMFISLLLIVQVYYTAVSNYSIPPRGDVMGPALIVLGFLVAVSLFLSFTDD